MAANKSSASGGSGGETAEFDILDHMTVQGDGTEWRTEPLFMDDIENADFDNDERLEALRELLFEDDPYEVAEGLRLEGNKLFRTGKTEELRKALIKYTESLAALRQADKRAEEGRMGEKRLENPDLLKSSRKARALGGQEAEQALKDGALQAEGPDVAYSVSDVAAKAAIVYSNRAAVHLRLRNFRHALNDAKTALSADPDFVKAFFRAAQAACQLRDDSTALRYCKEGLARDPENKELKALRIEAKKIRKERAEEEAVEKEEQEKERKRESAQRALYSKRGISLGPVLFSRFAERGETEARLAQVETDDGEVGNAAIFSVAIVYDEYLEFDMIESVCELDTLDAHLSSILPPHGEKPSWDRRGDYTAKTVDLYYWANAVEPYRGYDNRTRCLFAEAEGANRDAVSKYWVKVDTSLPLLAALSRANHVVPGHPVFFVVARGSDFAKVFLASNEPAVLRG